MSDYGNCPDCGYSFEAQDIPDPVSEADFLTYYIECQCGKDLVCDIPIVFEWEEEPGQFKCPGCGNVFRPGDYTELEDYLEDVELRWDGNNCSIVMPCLNKNCEEILKISGEIFSTTWVTDDSGGIETNKCPCGQKIDFNSTEGTEFESSDTLEFSNKEARLRTTCPSCEESLALEALVEWKKIETI